MTWKSITIWVIVLIVVIAGAWYLFGRSTTAVPVADNMATTTAATSTAPAGGSTTTTTTQATTLRALATQGGNYTCSVNTISTGSQTRGTLFAAGGKTRLDFVSTDSAGTDTTIHIIRTGTTSYTWVDGQPGGVKAAITAASPIVQQPQGGNITVTDTAQLASSCRPWAPVASEFVPPTAIVFVAQ